MSAGFDDPIVWAMLPLWYAAFLLSLTCHEAAHAAVAYWGGDETAYRAGQVSLNPLPHLRREPVGAVLVPLASFFYTAGGWMMGWASAPYDPSWEARHPRRAAAMAAAGPAANLLLAAAAFGILRFGLETGWWAAAAETWRLDQLVVCHVPGGWSEGLGRLASVVLVLNLALFVFNLIPVPPLDGASVAGGALPRLRPAFEAMRGPGGWIGLMAAWLVFPKLFTPVAGWVLRWLYG